jgi:hypothetical protein
MPVSVPSAGVSRPALRGIRRRMVVIFKGPGQGPKVRFMPGCLIWSILLSVGLTILVNVLIRLL